MKTLINLKSIVPAAIFSTIFAAPLLACQPCLIEKSLSLKQTIEQADLIVMGNRIFDKTKLPEKEPSLIKVQFARILKGKVLENQAQVKSYYGMCPYGIVLPDAGDYVLFLTDVDNGNLWSAVNRCSVKALKLNDKTVSLDDGATEISLDEFLSEHIVKPEYKPIVKFLQLLKNCEDADVFGFDETKGGKWDDHELLSFVSPKGVTFSNVNEKPGNRRLSLSNLRRSLAGKKDNVWRQFVHLGHIYNQSYPQYSTLSFNPQPKGVVAELSGGYRLTFSRESGWLKLSKLEYLQVEGD